MEIRNNSEKARLLIRTLMESDFYLGSPYSLSLLERLALVKRLLNLRSKPDGRWPMERRIKQEGRLVQQNYKCSVWAWGRLQMIQSWLAPYRVSLFFPSGKIVELRRRGEKPCS